MKKYLSILLVFIFLFTLNFSIYTETKAFASVIDNSYAKGVMTILNMLVAGGLVTFNNANNAKALAVKLWDSASDSFKQAVNNANTLKNAVFVYEAGLWLELINNLKNWYNKTFNVPYIIPAGSSYYLDASYNYDTKSTGSNYTVYYKNLYIPFNTTLSVYDDNGNFYKLSFYRSYFHYDVFNSSGDNFNYGNVNNPTYDNNGFVAQLQTYKYNDGSSTSRLFISSYSIYNLDPSSSMSLDAGTFYSNTSLSYDGTGISIGEDVLNLESDTLANNVADTNVKIPSYDVNLSIDANINSVLDSLLGINANTYANSLSQTNILSNILNSVSSIATALTDGLVGDVTKVNFQPLQVSASAITNNFPFSLPWDLYNSVNAVVASGSIPDIDLIFYDPVHKTTIHNNINIGEKFPAVVELAPLIRSVFLFGFAISLIFATRRLLGGAE